LRPKSSILTNAKGLGFFRNLHLVRTAAPQHC
jgi:hypothetical protein